MKKILFPALATLVLSGNLLAATGEIYDPIDDYYSRYYGVEAPAISAPVVSTQATTAQATVGEVYDPVYAYYDRYYGLSEIDTTPVKYPRIAPERAQALPRSLDDEMSDPAVWYNGDY